MTLNGHERNYKVSLLPGLLLTQHLRPQRDTSYSCQPALLAYFDLLQQTQASYFNIAIV